MNNEIIEKLGDVTNSIENTPYIKKRKELINKLLLNKELIKRIEKLKEMDEYSSSYVDLKREIMENDDYKKYREYDKNLYYLVQTMNLKLKEITKE